MPLPDARARRRIGEDLDTNLLVEAGAGSGKTTELVARMCALVESGAATVGGIAAVTFTRKAAGELRERFQGRLESRLAALRAEEDGGGEGGVDPGEVVPRLTRALDEIDRAFVGTIHSFCARLLRERPLDVGLDPGFEELSVEERLVLRRRYWDSYLERLVRDGAPVMEELADAGLRPSRLVGLFDRLVENPDVHFPADDIEPPSPGEVAPVRAELEEIVRHGVELMPDHVPEKGWDSLQKKIRTLAYTLDVTGWEKPAELFDALALLCKPGPRGHSIVQKRWKDKALAKKLRDRADAFGVGDTEARSLVNGWYAHRYALAVRLARHAAEDFAEYRRRSGRLDFQDLLLLTARLLRTNTRARRELGRRYHRILVDEFQDTDPLQAEVVLLLASEPDAGPDGEEEEGGGESGSDEAGEGDGAQGPSGADWRTAEPRPGALFVVGDPKQSIYRFRRADIQLYDFVKERFRDFGDVLELTSNFRSRPPIGDLVNQLFRAPEFFPEEATAEQARFEPLNTRPGTEDVPAEGVFWYGVDPEGDRRSSVTEDDAGRLATWIRDRIDDGERVPGDFMILTRTKKYLAAYARALEARSIPVQVTGAGVGVEEELEELVVLLECMIDPTNPVKVLATLVGLFFGFDYERLVEHRLAGGALDVVRPGKRGHPEVVQALRTLHGWWRSASREPADVFVGRAVSELGLLPYAAAGDLGSIRAGAMAFALDAVRASALSGDASLPGALSALRSALELPEAEAPLEPGRSDVVRLMNLHQAKGLEARVVVLVDPSNTRDRRPDVHVERLPDGTAVGYLPVTEPRQWGRSRVLARPEVWEEKEAVELRFDAAEEVRLLYVAVTRAKEELVVGRWVEKSDKSAWSALDPWLLEHAEELDLAAREPRPREPVGLVGETAARRAEEARLRREALGEPSYRAISVTEVAKGELGQEAPTEVEEEVGDQGFRGYAWGSAVHGALAVAAGDPSEERLRAACRDLLVEHERPLDEKGRPTELDELVALVDAVRGSELWRRAGAARRVLAEVPFAAPGVRRSAPRQTAEEATSDGAGATGDGLRQLDLFGGDAAPAGPEEEAGEGEDDMVEILEGVIDLAFLEADGWVIADYKTDVGTDPRFPVRLEGYRRQVELYAQAWAHLTGQPVKERVLFFTTQGKVEAW